MLQMRNENVLLEEIVEEHKSGIIVPNSGYKIRKHRVVAVGPGAFDNPIEDLQVGQTVLIDTDERFDLEMDGRKLRIVNAMLISAIVPPEGYVSTHDRLETYQALIKSGKTEEAERFLSENSEDRRFVSLIDLQKSFLSEIQNVQ